MFAEEQRSGGVQSGISLPPARQRVLWSGLPGLGSSWGDIQGWWPSAVAGPWRGHGRGPDGAAVGAMTGPWWRPWRGPWRGPGGAVAGAGGWPWWGHGVAVAWRPVLKGCSSPGWDTERARCSPVTCSGAVARAHAWAPPEPACFPRGQCSDDKGLSP